ncbi:ABC transporter ATP-binding protein [Calderihabitans maritimus]|uniref:Amino acid ABC transporter ATPase n=1 Tax=Calderihabitans maritimus TaxID=1246530 RepID=A0A1Z5HQW2_9FIRM|nr:ABC transporter ATP-binding protein [Calderihabitans maritimus]GAW91922.1 amino acid ABC transporter ATPase [Calderihabitans maritimus]
MLLQVKDLKSGYKGVPAIHDVSFEIKKGEIVVIVGGNGAGKSTILRTISGLIRPTGGEIVFDGRRIDQLPAHEVVAAGIAHVPEGRWIFGRMTVQQNLILGAYTQKSEEERLKTLEMIYRIFPRLKERREQVAGTMSGGEQQMLAIARGLMSRPKLLMLDEPSLGIMPKLVMEILEMIREINQRGTTILLVEQNVHAALKLADRAYVLQTGRIVAEGAGRELMEDERIRKAYLGM